MARGLGLIRGKKMAANFLWAAILHRLVRRMIDMDQNKNLDRHTQRPAASALACVSPAQTEPD
jgi:hypothetical protein